MNKNNKKIALDALMSVFYILLLNLALTGVFLHEVIGLIILGLMALHLVFNRQWIKGITLSLFDKKLKAKTKFLYALNALLFLCMGTTIVTGVAISQELFAFEATASTPILTAVHVSSSYLCLLILAVHVALHWRFIVATVSKMLKMRAEGQGKRVISRVAAIAMVVVFLKITVDADVVEKITKPFITSAQGTTNTQALQDGSASTQTNASALASSAIESAQSDTQSLQDYLSGIVCTACHRHCLLSHPQCGRGRKQAQQAETEYYAKTGA